MATETPEFDPTGGRGFVLIQSIIVVLVAFLGAVVLAALGASLLGALGVARESMAGRVGLTVLQFAGFGVGLAGVLHVGDDWAVVTDHVRVPTLRDAGYAVAGLVAVLGAAAAVGQLLSALGIDVAQNQVIAIGRENPRFFLYMIPVSLLLVGPMEELLFRGTVQGLLRRAWGPAAAVVVASALFGLVHWVALTGAGSRVSYVAVAAALGLVLGAVYELTDNVVVPAAVHGVYNAVLFAVQYAVVTGVAG
ncbi:MAG: lysostaphin resistance A-like protein [Haloferacaceae archaeon]